MRFGTGYKTSALSRLAATAALGLTLALPAAAYAAPVRVMVDPGHGGRDPGAVSGPAVESKINLQISRAVAKEARRQGWSVAMTRAGDKFIPLTTRPAKATSYRADVFVSIHANSTGKKQQGAMTIYRTKQGKRLGQAIMRELDPITRYRDIGNRQDVRGLAVLRASKKPAVIVEVMSLSAPRERARIRDPKVQKRIAQAIVRGIAEYKGVKYKAADKPKPKAKPKPKPTPVTELTTTGSPATTLTLPTPTVQTESTASPQPTAAPVDDNGRAGLFARLFQLIAR